MMTYPPKITFGEMRASGVRGVLIYWRDHRCSHHTETNGRLGRRCQALRHRTDFHLYALRQARRGGAAEILACAYG